MTENVNLPNYMIDKREILKNTDLANDDSAVNTEVESTIANEFDQRIPTHIFNRICYEEALKNNAKYRSEAVEFTNSIVKDNVTREILDEAEATTNLSKFDFGEIDEYLKKLEDLSFLEAVSYKKKIDEEIARWKSCNSMLKAIADLKLDDTVNRELMKINAMEDYEFTESIDDFESHYDDKLNMISNKLVEMVNSHKHEMDSTSFLTNEMIHLMKVKLDKLDPNGINYEYNKTRMETVIKAFSNRRDLSFLGYKLEVYLKTSKNNIKRDFRDNESTINNNRRTKVINDLIRFFSEDIVYAIYERLMCAFNDDIYATYIMMGFLAKIMNTEKKTSKDIWAKVFALNLSDIYNNIFDIDILADGEDSYMRKIEKKFYPEIKKFLDSQKIKERINHRVAFGLKTPVKKTKPSIPEETVSNGTDLSEEV